MLYLMLTQHSPLGIGVHVVLVVIHMFLYPPHGGSVNCAQFKILGKPFRSQRTLDAHPSPLGIGVLSSSSSSYYAIIVDLFVRAYGQYGYGCVRMGMGV